MHHRQQCLTCVILPELKLKLPFTDYLISRAGGEKQLMEFVKALRDFAVKSNFMRFYKDHHETYKTFVDNAKKNFADADPVQLVENYFGTQKGSYTLILAPLTIGDYGLKVEDQSGNVDIYSIMGSIEIIKDIPQIGEPKVAQLYLWHEFSHSFANPSTHKFMDQFNLYSSLFNPIKEAMKKNAYGDWESCIDEHIVRAVTFRLLKKIFDEKSALKEMDSEVKKGFVYVPALFEKLEYYETNRDKFPTFEDFLPEIINIFKEFSEKELGEDFYETKIQVSGIINEILSDTESLVFVIPTNEKDPDVQKKLHEYIREISKKMSPESSIITDKEALELESISKNMVIYGTFEGNLWLKHYSKCFPFEIKKNKIIAGKKYKGSDLRFISSYRHPQNPQKFVVIYTAQKAEDIIGINDIDNITTQYVIAEGTDVIKADNY